MCRPSEELNSRQFLLELQSGSADALARLDSALSPKLLAFLHFTMGVPEADAEEMTCDVLLTVTTKVKKFIPDGGAKLTTWIFTIAKNKAIDFHRRRVPEEVALAEHHRDDRLHTDFAGRNQELLGWLNAQLATLPDQDRYILIWRAMEYPYSTIAEWLGIAEGTARTRHSRVQAALSKASDKVKT